MSSSLTHVRLSDGLSDALADVLHDDSKRMTIAFEVELVESFAAHASAIP